MTIGDRVDDAKLELLLPWYAAGLLSEDDENRVAGALVASPHLVSRFEQVQHERAETISLNENLGTPSKRVMTTLMAAIDAECASKRRAGGFAGFVRSGFRSWRG